MDGCKMRQILGLILLMGFALGFLFLFSFGQSIPLSTYTASGIITDKAVSQYDFLIFINNTQTYRVTNDVYAKFNIGDSITFIAGHPLLSHYEVITEASK